MSLSFTPKFHLLHEHTRYYLVNLNDFFDAGEDAIERWCQMRIRHHARIVGLRSADRQKIVKKNVIFLS